jgi:outer membrane protein assembly factor BamB
MKVVDAKTGQILFTCQDTTLNGIFWGGAATIANGVLYDGSDSGRLFAFGLFG